MCVLIAKIKVSLLHSTGKPILSKDKIAKPFLLNKAGKQAWLLPTWVHHSAQGNREKEITKLLMPTMNIKTSLCLREKGRGACRESKKKTIHHESSSHISTHHINHIKSFLVRVERILNFVIPTTINYKAK